MKTVTITLSGADDLANQLSEIEELVFQLRRKIQEVNTACLRYEVQVGGSANDSTE